MHLKGVVNWFYYHQGRRKNGGLELLLQKVAHLPIGICHTNNWEAYQSCLPCNHLYRVGKDTTWKIEKEFEFQSPFEKAP